MNRKTIIIILALTATTITTMGLFNFFRGNNNRFVTEKQFNDNVAKQKQMNSQTLEQLIKYGITDTSELKLEFFFYTNEQEKASKLAIELKKLNYEIDHVDTSASGKKEWIVSGWSTKIRMDLKTVTNWTTQMCKLGFDNDCEFDGWGTLPDQGVEVERSVDGKSFEQVGFVKGAGNSNQLLNYNLRDVKAFASAQNNTLYYRLKQVDMNGAFTYSPVVMVSNEAGNSSQLHQLIFDNDDVDDDPGTTVQDRLL